MPRTPVHLHSWLGSPRSFLVTSTCLPTRLRTHYRSVAVWFLLPGYTLDSVSYTTHCPPLRSFTIGCLLPPWFILVSHGFTDVWVLQFVHFLSFFWFVQFVGSLRITVRFSVCVRLLWFLLRVHIFVATFSCGSLVWFTPGYIFSFWFTFFCRLRACALRTFQFVHHYVWFAYVWLDSHGSCGSRLVLRVSHACCIHLHVLVTHTHSCLWFYTARVYTPFHVPLRSWFLPVLTPGDAHVHTCVRYTLVLYGSHVLPRTRLLSSVTFVRFGCCALVPTRSFTVCTTHHAAPRCGCYGYRVLRILVCSHLHTLHYVTFSCGLFGCLDGLRFRLRRLPRLWTLRGSRALLVTWLFSFAFHAFAHSRSSLPRCAVGLHSRSPLSAFHYARSRLVVLSFLRFGRTVTRTFLAVAGSAHASPRVFSWLLHWLRLPHRCRAPHGFTFLVYRVRLGYALAAHTSAFSVHLCGYLPLTLHILHVLVAVVTFTARLRLRSFVHCVHGCACAALSFVWFRVLRACYCAQFAHPFHGSFVAVPKFCSFTFRMVPGLRLVRLRTDTALFLYLLHARYCSAKHRRCAFVWFPHCLSSFLTCLSAYWFISPLVLCMVYGSFIFSR